MAVELARAYITLVPSFQGAQGQIASEMGDIGDKGGKEAGKRFGSGFKGLLSASFLGNVLADFAGAATRAVVGSIKEGFDELKRSTAIMAQTEAVIRSTGGAAGVTSEHIGKLAQAMQDVTATEAESVQEGANLLLTFKNIRNEAGAGNDVFDQSTRIMVDMARAMGTDVSSGAIQLGKALNDPIAGIGALSRVGVQFTEDQKGMITSLVEAGDVMGAQKIILQELNDQFGGSGSAYAQTYAGKIEQVSNKFGDLREKVLTAALPALMSFADLGIMAISSLTNSPLIDGLATKLTAIGTGAAEKLQPLFDALNKLGDSDAGLTLTGLLDELARTVPFFAALQPIMGALAPIMPALAQAFADLGPSLAELAIALAPIIPPLTDLALALLPPLVSLLAALAPTISGVVVALTPLASGLGDNIGSLTVFLDLIKAATTGDLPAMNAAINTTSGFFHDNLVAVRDLGAGFGGFTRDAVANFLGFTRTVGGNLAAFQGTVSGVFNSIQRGVATAIGAVGATLGGLPGTISRIFAGAGTWLYNSGRAIVQGFVNGLVSMVRAAANAAASVMRSVRNLFPHSPAKEGPFSGSGWTAVRKSGEALMNQFTGGMSRVSVAGAMGNLGSLRAAPLGMAAGGGGGGFTWNGNINTTQPADQAVVSRLREIQYRAGLG